MNRRKGMRYLISLILLLTLIGSMLFSAGDRFRPVVVAGNAPAPPQQLQAEVTPASRTATSTQPLRNMAPVPVNLAGGREKKRVRLNPNVTVNLGPPTPDPVIQRTVPGQGPTNAPVINQSAPIRNFDGIGDKFKGPQAPQGISIRSAPPDTVGAVGTTQFVQWVNTSFAIFDKVTKATQVGPIPGNLLFKELGGNCFANNDGDPIVQFDKFAQRWVLAQFSVNNGFSQCVAVSTSADAGGTYHLYEFTYQAFDDYPKMGVWRDGYYTTFNMFDSQDRSLGSRVCAFDRARMLQGLPATQQCFQLSPAFFGLLPSDVDGATSALADAAGNPNGPLAPPANAPNYVVGLDVNSRSLDFWKFHVDWNNSNNSTFGVGPNHTPDSVISVAPFRLACNGSGQNCVTQPGNPQTEKLDTLGERLMFRLAYRRFNKPNGIVDHESLVLNHSVDVGTTSPQTAVRWYELRNPNANPPTVFQQGSYAPDATHRWMGSIAMDKTGGLTLGYSVSSSNVSPGIRYTSRAPGDPLGILGAETTLFAGTGSQRCRLPNGTCVCPLQGGGCDTLTRWGDYSDLSIDPTDDCTIWFTTEYQKSNGAFNWHTRIGSFKLKGCS